ncbi:exocyst complex component 3-like protein isoform X6 [Equus przewalskii]|uniref:Exocyst complex component 3-like protein isoform X6 n=1 Tax=Equus przewalskii TaxID=9798 RepID=A0ABM4NTE6_EQUPR
MDSAAKDEMQPALLPGSSCPGPEWPEQERAERLARGAALKWASGIFYRPEQLARLSQYRSREVQRTCSLEARIKSVVQSYLEGVKTGMWQLARALEAVHGAREALGQARGLLRGMAEAAQTLEPLRERVAQHKQLQALSQLLPRLRAVPAAVAHTQTLIGAQQLLEAYVSLRELEQLREETWEALGGLELPIFERLGPLAEALGQAVEAAAGAAGKLAREDPALLVAAVRVAEVDAGCTTSLEQAPRDWRQRCLRALQEGLEQIHFGTPLLPGPGALEGWLEALRVALPAELAAAEALIAPCCPPHYKVVQLWAHTLHSGLRHCLQQLLEEPELGAADAFTLLHWALHVYLGPEMMGSLELGPEADVSQLEPLLTLENIEHLETTFVAKVQLQRRSDPILPRPPQGGSNGPSLRALSTGFPQPPISTQLLRVRPAARRGGFRGYGSSGGSAGRVAEEDLPPRVGGSPGGAPAPVRGSALAPVAVELGGSGRCVRADGALLPGLLARAESRGPAATGRGGAYRSAAVLTRADAGSPSVPRCRRADPGGRAPAARCRPASGAFPWFGPGGKCSVRAGAARPAGAAKPPRPHAAWPRGGGPAATISRRERGSRLCPLGPAGRRVPRAAPGRTELPAGWPTALARRGTPSTLQPRASTYARAVFLPPLGALCLTPGCPQNKVLAPLSLNCAC